LRQAIDALCEDAARVEFWACALSGFAQPVPDYDLRDKYGLRIGARSGRKDGFHGASADPCSGHRRAIEIP
jgi:hypothetical protein